MTTHEAYNTALDAQCLTSGRVDADMLALLVREGEANLAHQAMGMHAECVGASALVAFLLERQPEAADAFDEPPPVSAELSKMIDDAKAIRARAYEQLDDVLSRVAAVGARLLIRVPGAEYADTGAF